ncbi:Acetyltransferase (GNAT) domain-containing protein [Ekhidna lutea]|uniref:Acetyltransferase (GNAT) domain-containing protein n=1 Tax=Ekhidna lutea TaxID=447679 RepID=A0A239K795_EKHLU|nr:N-acetyltransferase [Ekhidna lutea]SNT13044.1 Acetyltransferase (GNAT) domain-containing protein [Ekhidna lutea]
MITELNHKDETVAKRIRTVFQASYAVEAKLLKAENNFPPLQRPIDEFIKTDNSFYGFHQGVTLAAVMEIKEDGDSAHIQSLVVDPVFFRKGIASKLLGFLFENFDAKIFTVETGAENGPAIALYERFGFTLMKKWMTEFGIEKVRFEKR